ncbi:hypothetical protein FNV43_RR09410 [Rhamnella rubrinervis]|uniref:PPM-type phosphatase domain-containing protein n=1 Tax=Rhamnella rubrinervis TaxID=2594499 RepID=A0A8K0H9X3_9ROSA|nr:hypothetical protein FNV43_RR09410 [Rhamnella rubrinervis]
MRGISNVTSSEDSPISTHDSKFRGGGVHKLNSEASLLEPSSSDSSDHSSGETGRQIHIPVGDDNGENRRSSTSVSHGLISVIGRRRVMEDAFARGDHEHRHEHDGVYSGDGPRGEEEIVVANCGDSRAVLWRGGAAVPLSRDHKPDRPDEMERIEAAGGRIIDWNGCRVLGVLATSRSIGDHYLKPYVIPEPEVTVCKRTKSDEFIVIATDGLWDVVSNEFACEVVRRCLDAQIKRRFPEGFSGSAAAAAATMLAEVAMARGSKDNISIIVVELNK